MLLSSLINELQKSLEENGDAQVVIDSPVLGTVRLDKITDIMFSPGKFGFKDRYYITAQ